jgi:hypothetical protein
MHGSVTHVVTHVLLSCAAWIPKVFSTEKFKAAVTLLTFMREVPSRVLVRTLPVLAVYVVFFRSPHKVSEGMVP